MTEQEAVRYSQVNIPEETYDAWLKEHLKEKS